MVNNRDGAAFQLSMSYQVDQVIPQTFHSPTEIWVDFKNSNHFSGCKLNGRLWSYENGLNSICTDKLLYLKFITEKKI